MIFGVIQMNKFKNIKKLALESIMLSMEEIKYNLESSAEPERVATNSTAMKQLAEAFHIVKGA